jgi:hypothetical protein
MTLARTRHQGHYTGAVSSRTPRKRRTAAILRNLGFTLALALGGLGIWLIVTGGHSTQRIEIGVLTGLWGLLLGAICGRRMVVAEPPRPSVEQPAPPPARATLAVPQTTGLDRAESAAARHAFAAELHAMLRRELANAVDNAIVREVGQLRAEIAELRSDLLERVNGQLRLQRIETTTLIGADLDAMRAEVRGLQEGRTAAALTADIDLAPGTNNGAVTSAAPTLDPPSVQPIVDPPSVRPIVDAPARPLPAPSPPPPLQATPASLGADPFAALPRLTPFTAFPLEPIETPTRNGAVSPIATERTGRPLASEPPVSEAPPPARDADAIAARPAGRRRRANDPEGQELLARLLAREGARR